jgi:hypothetical protein
MRSSVPAASSVRIHYKPDAPAANHSKQLTCQSADGYHIIYTPINMVNARISGIASYVPDDILDNEMLSKMVDTNDEWITTRVGIKERRILRLEGEGSSYLGAKAVEKLIAETGVNPDEIELVICATSNPDYRFPSTASVIVEKTGLKNAYAYDIQAACAGFLVALQDGSAYIRSHQIGTAQKSHSSCCRENVVDGQLSGPFDLPPLRRCSSSRTRRAYRRTCRSNRRRVPRRRRRP